MKLNLVKMALIAMVFAAATVASADQQAMFNYQGRVKVQGTPFNGAGQFKFAIVNTAGNVTLWSHDGTSTGGLAPSGAVSLDVNNGIFNAMIGDTNAPLNMEPINTSIFNSPTPLKLRVWFSDGSLPSEQLNPDTNLVNLSLIIVSTGSDDFTIYVDGTNGDDDNNGLTPATAKKTIQAAADTLPDRINCNVTIDVADGTYHEEVAIHGLSVKRGKTVTFLGDPSFTPGSGAPAVVISGADPGAPTVPVRDFAFYAQQCTGIVIQGFYFTRGVEGGMWVENGDYTILNCLAKDNLGWAGITATRQCFVTVENCEAKLNNVHGMGCTANSRGWFTDIRSSNNGGYGLAVQGQTMVSVSGSGYFDNNQIGIQSRSFAEVGFGNSFVGSVSNNTLYGIIVQLNSICTNATQAGLTITGNGTNMHAEHGGSFPY